MSGLVLAALLGLVFWITSLSFGDFRPESSAVTFVLWALLICVVIGTIALGFLLARSLVKLYIERRHNKPGSRIRSKLVVGVLALSVAPIALHVVYSISLLNRNFDKWFSQPTVEVLRSAERFLAGSGEDMAAGLQAEADELAATVGRHRRSGSPALGLLKDTGLEYLAARRSAQGIPDYAALEDGLALPAGLRAVGGPGWDGPPRGIAEDWLYATAPIPGEGGLLVIGRRLPASLRTELEFMDAQIEEWKQLEAARPVVWRTYAYILALITLFMVFLAVWLAEFTSRQITRPIRALVTGTGELAGGHLDYRVETPATDELAGLVVAFNKMGQALEGKTRELQESNLELARSNAESEDRRRFIKAILESITPAVVSVSGDLEVLQHNESARQLARDRCIVLEGEVTSLLHGTDRPAFRHLFSSARRTGLAAREFEVERNGRPAHLSVTVSPLDSDNAHHGFVVVLEDTTEIRRAQRSEAWREVARRLAHEIKNPLTPVALAAGRIDRLLERLDSANDESERQVLRQRLQQSTSTIDREVQSLKSLVDSFSAVARFPAIRPEPTDLNQLVRESVGVFDGRLPGIRLILDTEPGVPLAWIDPEPFRRVIVNLIDNAAEGLEDCWVREIAVATRKRDREGCIELSVADSGPGISPENREKLFVPYFSTKARGTGLGLSIVSKIVRDHHGSIRIEDNDPSGSRFIIEVPTVTEHERRLQEVA